MLSIIESRAWAGAGVLMLIIGPLLLAAWLDRRRRRR